MKKLLLLIITALCIYFPALAQPFPANCKPVNYKFEKHNLILNVNKLHTNVFLFNNISKENFWLDHAVAHPSVSAGWGSKLDQGNWSALLLNNNSNFAITCSRIHPGSVDYLSCREFLKVCELQNVSFQKTNGSYWLAENQPLPTLIKTLQQRGVN